MLDSDKLLDLITKYVNEQNMSEESYWDAFAENYEENLTYGDSDYIDNWFLKMAENGTLISDEALNFFAFESPFAVDFLSIDESDENFIYNGIVSNFNSEIINPDLNSNSVNHTHGWLYSFSENFFAYTYDITYFIFESYYYAEMPQMKNRRYWFAGLKNEQYNILNAFLMDQIYALSILMLPYFNEFLKNFANSIEFSSFLENHPEYYLIFKDYALNNYYYYFSNYYISLYSLNISESFLTPVMIIFQFFFIFFSVLALFLVYFNYYGDFSSEENIIDHDYLIFNVTIEAEEEIGSLDDMLLASVILLYIFLWFFWIHSWSSVGIMPKLSMSIYLFPFIYYIIIFIPFSLLYDYGLYFLTYLNGVGKSSILLVELMFDYIAVSIFYLRLIVQNVRLAFMLFTFLELHELVIFYNINKNLFPLNDNYIDAWDNVKIYSNYPTYYLIFCAPTMLIKWLYELFHTFFMVIFQFVAFFAMIFWLFLFLYSMFVSEKQENHLTFKRIFRKNFFKERINLKLVKI